MIQTNNFNETIREFFEDQGIRTHDFNELFIDRTGMVQKAPNLNLDENACYDYWLDQVRQRVPPYAYVNWSARTDDWLGVEVWIDHEPRAGECDKCGQVVEKWEDATLFAAIYNDSPATPFISGKRHIRCSPSRAQFIVHPYFPPVVDTRPAFDKQYLNPVLRAELEEKYTKAWTKLQEEYRGQPAIQ